MLVAVNDPVTPSECPNPNYSPVDHSERGKCKKKGKSDPANAGYFCQVL